MFTKAAWSIFGITPDSEKAFLASINSIPNMYALSQAFAEAAIRAGNAGSVFVGLNPFEHPRKDEAGQPLGSDYETVTPDRTLFGVGEEEFRISPDLPWYGLWMVINENDDVDDIKSKQEELAYVEFSRPFKFLGKDAKKSVEAMAKPHNVGTRKQFPVLLDFKSGRAYILSTNKDEITTVRSTLEDLGIVVLGLAWDFGDAEWVETFLNRVDEKNKFFREMKTRADEVRRGLDIVPLEDKTMERVVQNFFALSELDSGQWVGLFPNTAIKLYEGGGLVTVADVSDAVNLLDEVETSTVRQAGVVIQELDSRFNKKGEETFVRTDLFAFDLNQNWALLDEGAAVVRGFDIPNFKKDILKAIRKSKQEQPVAFYWSEWLRQMNQGVFALIDNINLTLGVKGGLVALDDAKTTDFDTSGEEGVPLPSVAVRTAE